jgi:hypothetical protein
MSRMRASFIKALVAAIERLPSSCVRYFLEYRGKKCRLWYANAVPLREDAGGSKTKKNKANSKPARFPTGPPTRSPRGSAQAG